eukprot:Lithocolla_globosa_v1_NODE_818_length_3236_cov_18.549026.p3 type:complete len:255 gc:universal NODE_818_length_3236_cov_18.549026:2343-3107(+)
MIRNRVGRTYAGFLDFSKAFDSVWREGLWKKLYEKGVKGKMLRMIQMWYEGSKTKVEWLGVETDWMDVEVGVKQGCVLSGLLFAVYVDDLFEYVEKVGKGAETERVGEEQWRLMVTALMYADDLTVVAENGEGLKKLVEAVMEWSRKWRMRLSEGKCEVVVFGVKGLEKPGGWEIGGMKIKEKTYAKNLGIEMDEMLTMDVFRKRILKKAGGMIWMTRRVVRILGEEAGMTAWRSFARSVLLYGNEVFVWDRKQ